MFYILLIFVVVEIWNIKLNINFNIRLHWHGLLMSFSTVYEY